MSSTTVLVMIGVPILLLGVLVLLSSMVAGAAARRRGAAVPGLAVPQQSFQMPYPPVPADVQARALDLIAQQKLIAAIKEVRQATGMGLKEAKDYCEALRDGRLPPAPPAFPGYAPSGGPLSDRARAFLEAGDRDAAIALVRAETGMSPDEASRFVDALN